MTSTTESQLEPRGEEPERELALADLDLPEERAGKVTRGAHAAEGIPGGCDD